METAADRLQQIIDETGLSKKEFCKQVGTTPVTLNRILSGQQNMTKGFARKVEATLDVGADWLLNGNEETKEAPITQDVISFLNTRPDVRKALRLLMDETPNGKYVGSDGPHPPDTLNTLSTLCEGMDEPEYATAGAILEYLSTSLNKDAKAAMENVVEAVDSDCAIHADQLADFIDFAVQDSIALSESFNSYNVDYPILKTVSGKEMVTHLSKQFMIFIVRCYKWTQGLHE